MRKVKSIAVLEAMSPGVEFPVSETKSHSMFDRLMREVLKENLKADCKVHFIRGNAQYGEAPSYEVRYMKTIKLPKEAGGRWASDCQFTFYLDPVKPLTPQIQEINDEIHKIDYWSGGNEYEGILQRIPKKEE